MSSRGDVYYDGGLPSVSFQRCSAARVDLPTDLAGGNKFCR